MKEDKQLKEISKKLDKLIKLMENINRGGNNHYHYYPPKREELQPHQYNTDPIAWRGNTYSTEEE